MKPILSMLLLLCGLPGGLLAQLHVAGGTLKISAGATLHSTGNVTNTGGGTLVNDGTLNTPGSITNSGAAMLSGNGLYSLHGDWTNSADFAAGTSTVIFSGAANSTATSGGDAFFEIKMSKTSADLLLADDLGILDTLHFLQNDNLVRLSANDLTLAAAAGVTGFGTAKKIVTDGSGQVRKAGLGVTAFVFPVGFDASTYNPLTIVQSAMGTVETFGVRVLENVLENGSSGSALTEGVAAASWQITEAVAGGSDLTLTAQWASTDELPGFDRTDSGISRYDGTGWDMTNGMVGVATGTGPFTRSRSGIADLGTFAVGSEPLLTYLLVSPKVFLQGPYSATTGLMNDNLRSANPVLIPLTEPYSAAPTNFGHVGRGGGETVAASVFTTTGNNAIVDWVFLQLRDKNNSATVLQTRSALVQRDGDIVELDGTSPVKVLGMAADDYYFSVRHRNHLGVRTPAVLALSRTATSHDFTTAQTQAYKPANHPNQPMDTVKTTVPLVFGMWGGNANSNANVRYSGPSNDNNQLLNTCLGGDKTLVLSNQYSPCDLNMNGNIRYSGPANDNNTLLNVVLGGNKTIVITQPAF